MSGQQFDDVAKAVANGANGTTRGAFLKQLLVGVGAPGMERRWTGHRPV